MTPPRRLAWLLRAIGLLDLLAFLALAASPAQIARLHAQLGMGTFPEAVITVYLARTASMLYGFCGLLLLFLSTDVERYRPVIRFLALAGLIASALLLWIDVRTGMPWWWSVLESTACASLWGAVCWCVFRYRHDKT
ncbi:hypothetical protein GC163_13625 [bacterium]|nr:hypothetical protein [bacterium]